MHASPLVILHRMMDHSIVVFTSWVLLVILGGVATLVQMESPCPDGCLCIERMLECGTFANSSTWVDYLGRLPLGTKSLTVSDAVFPSMALPDNIAVHTFPNMTYLRITHCNISVVGPKAFRLFPDLIELHLDSDAIRELHVEALYSLSSLKLLNLTQNVITRLHENTFQGTNDLQILDLAYNQIDILYPRVFANTAQLQMLNLSKNNVDYIHPATFSNLSQLHTIDLNHNQLEVLHPEAFMNLTSLRHVSIDGNPWSCDCGMHWLHPRTNRTHPLLRSLKEGVWCHSPPEYNSMYLDTISPSNLACTIPEIINKLMDVSLLRLDSTVLKCNATGSPWPSVYWITPHGVLAVPKNQMWMNKGIIRSQNIHEFVRVPKYHKSNIVALEDGSLIIHQVRAYLAGKYTCVAENPAGVSFSMCNIAVKTAFHSNMRASMVVGAGAAMCFFVISVIYVSIRTGVYHWLKLRHTKKTAVSESDGDASSPLKQSPTSEYGNRYPSSWSSDYISPYESPIKCTTPVEVDADGGQQQRTYIRETLEDVRFHLRAGMERSVTKIRTGAHQVSESSRHYIHSMRESSNHYMQNIRESGSHTIHNLRSTGSQAANKMRAGVVLSVEQVKYHVQSMKELCLTGNLGQTISTISVATNVDSHEKTDVVKKITFV